MKERIFEGNLSGLGIGVAKKQTGEVPTIELVSNPVAATEIAAQACPPYPPLCLPNNYPCPPRRG